MPSPTTKQTSSQTTSPTITPLRKGACKTLEGQGKLDYELGTDDHGDLHWRITRNSGGGFFSDEWVSFSSIRSALEEWPQARPMTSLVLRSLFKGRSANNPSFLLATLLAEGVVTLLEGRRRQYAKSDLDAFLASTLAARHKKTQQGSPTAKQANPRRMRGKRMPAA